MKRPSGISAYAAGVALVAVASLFCEAVRPFLSPTNMVMAYLLAVVLAASWLGLRPAIVTACLGVLAFDFFFVPPRYSFSVADKEYLVTFIGLFTVGVVISSLVAKVRERSEEVRVREAQTASLYHLNRDLAAAADTAAILTAVVKNVEESLHAQPAVFMQDGKRFEIVAASRDLHIDASEREVALWAFRSRRMAGHGTGTFSSASLTCIPLLALANTLGVLGIKPGNEPDFSSPQNRRLLDAFATQIAMALERGELARQVQQAQIMKARGELERALLNSVSHDLRTPLVTITGVLSSVLDEGDRLNENTRRELLSTARDEAGRLNRFVGNLLDMTRLEAGAVILKKEPTDVQDLIGCALAAVDQRLGKETVQVRLPEEPLLAALDMVLMVQVLINLLDNALKYSPPGGIIEITACSDGPWLTIDVADTGPGIPEKDLERIFDKFYRLPVPEGAGGTGLGLSICKGIVEAHGGSIRAGNRAGGGLVVSLKVPMETSVEE